MIALDIKTVLFSYVLTNALCVAVIASLWRANRKRSAGLGFWLANAVLQFLALSLVALRGTVPPAISIMFGSPLIVGGNILLYIGLERYTGKPGPQWHNALLFAALVAAQAWFALVQPSLAARNLILSLAVMALCAQCAWLLLRRVDAELRRDVRWVGMIFAAYMLFSMARLMTVLLVPSQDDVFASGAYQVLVVMFYQLLSIGLAFGLFLMVNRRVAANLEQDITEKKQAQDALRVSEQHYLSLLEQAADAILVVGQDKHFREGNARACELFGYKREEFAGMPITAVVVEHEVEKQMQAFARIQQGERLVAERQFRRKDGTLFAGELVASKIDDDFVLGIVRDITERKQAEAALQQSEADIRTKLKAITEPEGDIGALELADIIDAEMLQSLMEDFYQLTGILGAVLDISGKVLVAVGWQEICLKFHRCHAETRKNCIESDTILTQGVPAGAFKAYRCKNNMWDMVTPLMIGGRHVGNVFIGQFFYEGEMPDVASFCEQARRYGFDEAEYLAALERVPRFSREKVDTSMRFYSKLAEIISTLSYSTLQQSRLLAERERAQEQVRGQLAELLRWQQVTIGREKRVQQLKDELNRLLEAQGQAPRYPGPTLTALAEVAEPDARGSHE